MTVYLSRSGDTLLLRATAAGGGITGDVAREVRPGGSEFGRTYAEWAALPDGPHEVAAPPR
jgi:hypothetical protein